MNVCGLVNEGTYCVVKHFELLERCQISTVHLPAKDFGSKMFVLQKGWVLLAWLNLHCWRVTSVLQVKIWWLSCQNNKYMLLTAL